MDVSLAIKQRLDELGLDQRDLARAAQVTESYISQLLTRRRPPPAPNRTDIYDKMDRLLKLPKGELATLATHQRHDQLKRELGDDPAPLFGEVRALILRKCHPGRQRAVRAIFETQSFGELERLVTRTILSLVKQLIRAELDREQLLRTVAKVAGRSYQEMRVVALEFLDTDILQLSPENCLAFLNPLVRSWDIDLATFELSVELNPKVSPGPPRRFRFTELSSGDQNREAGLSDFLRDRELSGSATDEEIALLDSLRFTSGRPTALFYYRTLQNLRDPLHFRVARASRTSG